MNSPRGASAGADASEVRQDDPPDDGCIRGDLTEEMGRGCSSRIMDAEVNVMLYSFMTLNDNTEIVHSGTINDNGRERVKVCIERPIYGGFQSVECYLPEYEWCNNNGFSDEDIAGFQELLESTAHIIIELAREGGLEDAANF